MQSSAQTLPAWLASIPDPFGPSEGLAAATAALDDSAAVVDEVRARFHGTLPPPPWPATPELVQAREAMLGAKTFFQRINDAAPESRWRKGDKAGIGLVKGGTALFTETAKLEDAAAKAPDLPSLVKLLPSSSIVQGLKGLELLALAGLAWLAWSERNKIARVLA